MLDCDRRIELQASGYADYWRGKPCPLDLSEEERAEYWHGWDIAMNEESDKANDETCPD